MTRKLLVRSSPTVIVGVAPPCVCDTTVAVRMVAPVVGLPTRYGITRFVCVCGMEIVLPEGAMTIGGALIDGFRLALRSGVRLPKFRLKTAVATAGRKLSSPE